MGVLADRVRFFFNEGSDRSVKARKNAAAMLLLKGGNVLIGLALVPLTLTYVDSDTYGIWIALSSMVAWMSMFDIGLNNGLRNKLAEALAAGDRELGRRYVSTTYALMTMIFVPLMSVLVLASGHIDWSSLLRLPQAQAEGIAGAACVIIVYFCLNFILSTVNMVIMAEQRPAYSSLISFIQQLTSLAVIFVLTKTTQGNLMLLCLGLCASPLVIIALSTLVLYLGRYREIAPSLKHVDMKLTRSLLGLGVQFFIIQVAAVIQYQMLNFLIIRYHGASDVTAYNISYRYFSIAMMFWGILTTPLWTASTDAFARNDIGWIRESLKKYKKLLVVAFAGLGVLLALSPLAYRILSHGTVEVPAATSFWVMAYSAVMMAGTLYVNVVNGSGRLRIQTISSLISPFVFIGLCALFIHIGTGVHGIVIAALVSNFNGYLLAPLQCRHMLKQN